MVALAVGTRLCASFGWSVPAAHAPTLTLPAHGNAPSRPILVQRWHGYAQSRRRCGTGDRIRRHRPGRWQVAAIRADVTALEYSAAKGALISLVRSAADRLVGRQRRPAQMPLTLSASSAVLGSLQPLHRATCHISSSRSRKRSARSIDRTVRRLTLLATGPCVSGVRVNAILPGGVVTGMTASVAMDLDKQGLSVKG
jgi:hypothetical protein